ncbi:hypothetical protein H4219_000031 [Mycoemilia scoparia]|uniref:Uncharacterized protein n=1 Tax=Mycoemilia scoparia TaxID=417184 RepID=A0A9W8ACH6_9FUNG|nr:hypothetical protein H4219_000031 [Mycoemilia scoparia]
MSSNGSASPHLSPAMQTPRQKDSEKHFIDNVQKLGARSAPPKTRTQLFRMDPQIAKKAIHNFELSQISRNIKAGFARLQTKYAKTLPLSKSAGPATSALPREAFRASTLTRHVSLESNSSVATLLEEGNQDQTIVKRRQLHTGLLQNDAASKGNFPVRLGHMKSEPEMTSPRLMDSPVVRTTPCRPQPPRSSANTCPPLKNKGRSAIGALSPPPKLDFGDFSPAGRSSGDSILHHTRLDEYCASTRKFNKPGRLGQRSPSAGDTDSVEAARAMMMFMNSSKSSTISTKSVSHSTDAFPSLKARPLAMKALSAGHNKLEFSLDPPPISQSRPTRKPISANTPARTIAQDRTTGISAGKRKFDGDSDTASPSHNSSKRKIACINEKAKTLLRSDSSSTIATATATTVSPSDSDGGNDGGGEVDVGGCDGTAVITKTTTPFGALGSPSLGVSSNKPGDTDGSPNRLSSKPKHRRNTNS